MGPNLNIRMDLPQQTEQKRFTLKKGERLCSTKLIERLFKEGESFLQYPLKFVFLPTELPSKFPAQVGFSVSKRNFKRAVKRNRIKRLLRESYRLNKNLLYEELNQPVSIFIIYIGKALPRYSEIERAMKKGLLRLSEHNSVKTDDAQGTSL